MPYRETAAEKEPRFIDYGPFRLAWVRLALAAVLLMAVGGALRGLAGGHLECDRQECALEVGWVTRHFAWSDLVEIRVRTSQLRSTYRTSRGGSYSADSVKVFIPEVELTSGTFALFEMEEEATDKLIAAIETFRDDPEAPSLSLKLEATGGGPILQLIVFVPLLIFFVVSGVRGGGGMVELGVDGDELWIRRRWGRLGGKARWLPARDFRGVEVEYRGRRGLVTLLGRNGHELPVTDRFLAAVDPRAHERAAQELRVALACPVMPEKVAGPPSPGSSLWSALVGGVLGVPLGLALCGAVDLLWNGVGGALLPPVALVVGCLLIGIGFGSFAGARRVR